MQRPWPSRLSRISVCGALTADGALEQARRGGEARRDHAAIAARGAGADRAGLEQDRGTAALGERERGARARPGRRRRCRSRSVDRANVGRGGAGLRRCSVIVAVVLPCRSGQAAACLRWSARRHLRPSTGEDGRCQQSVALSSRLARDAMAYVLAGGRGSRLMELTDKRAKPAVYFGGKIAHHRLRAVQRAELRHPPHRRRHPVQGAQPDPPPAARLELPPPGAQRELRHPAGEPARLGDAVVRGHRRRGLPEHRHHRELRARRYIVILAGDHVYKMDYELMLRAARRRAAPTSRSAASRCRAWRRSASASWHVDDERPHRRRSWRSRRTRPACPASPDMALASMGIYVFETRLPDRPAARATPPTRTRATISARTSSRTSSRTARRWRTASRAPASAPTRRGGGLLARRRHDRRLLGGQYRPHRRRSRRSTSTTSDWPIWTYGEITPPAKFVHDDDGRRGMAVDSLVSGGCIISGAVAAPLAAVHRRARPFLRRRSRTR